MYHLGGSRFLEYQTAASRLNRYSARKVYASYLTRRLILGQCLNLFASTGSNRCWDGTGLHRVDVEAIFGKAHESCAQAHKRACNNGGVTTTFKVNKPSRAARP